MILCDFFRSWFGAMSKRRSWITCSSSSILFRSCSLFSFDVCCFARFSATESDFSSSAIVSLCWWIFWTKSWTRFASALAEWSPFWPTKKSGNAARKTNRKVATEQGSPLGTLCFLHHTKSIVGSFLVSQTQEIRERLWKRTSNAKKDLRQMKLGQRREQNILGSDCFVLQIQRSTKLLSGSLLSQKKEVSSLQHWE